jgi:hypothetical protein
LRFMAANEFRKLVGRAISDSIKDFDIVAHR